MEPLEKVFIREVGPRDGLQNERLHWTPVDRAEFIRKLTDCGIQSVEAVSFVSSKVVPQMAGAEEVMENLVRRSGVEYVGLVLNATGLQRALATQLDTVNVVVAVSDTFQRKNAGKGRDEALAELLPLAREAVSSGLTVEATLGTAFGCPFEGEIETNTVWDVTERLLAVGVSRVTLADTTGMAHPAQVESACTVFQKKFGQLPGLHFHNTRGLGMANVYAGYVAGARRFDASFGGLGGCPFAPLSVGNVCTEDVVHMFEQMDVSTGIDLARLLSLASWVTSKVEHELPGYVWRAGPTERANGREAPREESSHV
ncbi:MAG: hydroxymethylglutaryl-CoA lyase [Alicyclobacillaceae bacterium]|nr:hydroxymethylglutaryl-CoA lyase [Alicyclobacillaceae bacterium]